jgi:uncharacterized RmlC-like cupin family protein
MATGIEKIQLQPAYRNDNGSWVLDTQLALPKDVFTPVEQFIMGLPPGQVVGNHKHTRGEALIGIGAGACFLWQTQDGTIHEEAMNPNGQFYAFVIAPDVPHAVINRSPTELVFLYKYFDAPNVGVERVILAQALELTQ